MSVAPEIQENRPLAPLTSWKVGGPAALFAEPRTEEELRFCLRVAAERGLPVLALGGGSNMLVADGGYPGLVVRYAGAGWELIPVDQSGATTDVRLRLGARVALARAARRAVLDGYAGLEWAEGIPGTIGGAVVGNAGAYGGEIASVVESVDVLIEGSDAATDAHARTESIDAHAPPEPIDDGVISGYEVRTLRADQCAFGYRTSRFKGHEPTRSFILSATFRLVRDDPERLERRIREISRQRRARTPAGLSCGSVFRNPPGDFAGRLIEAVGLKGAEHGAAWISPQHGNYFVNRGGATARDLLALVDLARERVRRETGIELELEVQLVGFPAAAV